MEYPVRTATLPCVLASNLFLLLLVLLPCHAVDTPAAAAAPSRSTYIIHMSRSQIPSEFIEHRNWYDASLRSVSASSGEPSLLYEYTTAAHGFSALLTNEEADLMRARDGVLSVVPDQIYHLHTTRSPEFLGLTSAHYTSFAANLNATAYVPPSGASDVIVGVLDTGAWPGSRSYNDAGLGPIPKTWRGACESGPGFDPKRHCNKKLIGARFFSKGYEAALGPINPATESRSPRDEDGHGTHTSTTVAGAAVSGASLFGFATGTARGMAPQARIAAYKVCWLGGCLSSDILAALDKAVEDGVGVLSMSLGGGQSDYYRDPIAVGAFAAMEKGILVSCSAGNSGPGSGSLSNVAPWITTVGAGTIDRDFPAYVLLGNGKNYTGVSVYSDKPLSPTSKFPLIYAGNASTATASGANLCLTGTLDPKKVTGKIVLCERGGNARARKGSVVKQAGGIGMVLANTAANGEELVADSHLLPAANVGQKAGEAIQAYILHDPHPTATIVVAGTKLGVKPSPVVAAFSSRGPNGITPEILKPDMIAPGVNILAGWSGAIGPTGISDDKRRSEFNIVSGTSMSCPHVSGLAALVKGVRPGWSPAAIRSALMTTAYSSYSGGAGGLIDVATGATATPFDLGAGHVEPVRALDPGLVYDISPDEYLGFLCALNYSQLQIAALSRRSDYNCDAKKRYAVSDLNYPSFAVAFTTTSSSQKGAGARTMTVKHTRTLTNVGAGPAKYTASIAAAPENVKVVLEPAELTFARTGDKQSFTVTFTASSQPSGTESFGRLEWSDGKHVVGSPMAITWT